MFFFILEPVVKKRKHAEEEEEDEEYTHEISGSDEGSGQEEEEAVEEEEEEEEIQFESDGVSNDEEELPSTSKSLKEHLAKKQAPTKRKVVEQKTPPPKKTKTASVVAKTTSSTEKKHKKIIKKVATKGGKVSNPEKKIGNSTDDGKRSVNSIEFNDKNVDFNLYNEAPEHIKNVKIKISSNIVMLCRMIEATGNTSQGLTYDYAALSFVRQSKNGRAYEFNLPLNLAPSIVKGINLLIKHNPKFFEKQFKAPPASTADDAAEVE